MPGSDYACRLFVPKSVWSQVLLELNEEMDHDNFKLAAARQQGHNEYERALHKGWEAMYHLQG